MGSSGSAILDSKVLVSDDELILRRIRPHSESAPSILRDGLIDRPRRSTCEPRKRAGVREHGLSCSSFPPTSPAKQLAGFNDAGPNRWYVCGWLAGWIRAIRLGPGCELPLPMDIVRKPDPDDAGHCEIIGSDGSPCPHQKSVTNLLSRRAVVLPFEIVSEDFATVYAFVEAQTP